MKKAKWIIKKYKKVCKTLNYTEHLLILVSTIIGNWYCLVGIPECITSTAITTNISIITAWIKNYESTKKKKEKWLKSIASKKLNTIEILISKALIVLNFSHYELVLINNVLKEYDNMKESKDSNNKIKVWTISKTMLSYFFEMYKRTNNQNKKKKQKKVKAKSCKSEKLKNVLIKLYFVVVENQDLLMSKKLVD